MRPTTIQILSRLLLSLIFIVPLGCDFSASDSGSVRVPPARTDASPNKTDTGPRSDTSGNQDWLPSVTRETETVEVDAKAEEATLFDGEVVLTFSLSTFEDPVILEVTRNLVDVRGVNLVGYIWGPHGLPIEPAATVSIRQAKEDLPPWLTSAQEARLFSFDADTAQLTPLAKQKVEDDGVTVTITAELSELSTIVVGPDQ